MVEDVKEDILRFLLAAEELNVIDDEHINHLIEMTEVIHRIVSDGIDELVCEFLRAHVQYREFRLTRFDLKPNGVRKVGFSQSRPAINQQGIEGSSTGFVGYGIPR